MADSGPLDQCRTRSRISADVPAVVSRRGDRLAGNEPWCTGPAGQTPGIRFHQLLVGVIIVTQGQS